MIVQGRLLSGSSHPIAFAEIEVKRPEALVQLPQPQS
jgi:hypothetical protein